MSKITGIVYLSINGKLLRTEKGATMNFGGMNRTEKMANGILAGYQEEPVPAEIECNIFHTSSTDIEEIRSWVDATCKFLTDTGVSYLVTNAFLTEPPQLDDGSVAVKFKGDAAVEE